MARRVCRAGRTSVSSRSGGVGRGCIGGSPARVRMAYWAKARMASVLQSWVGHVLKLADGGALCDSTRQITASSKQILLPRRIASSVLNGRAIWAIKKQDSGQGCRSARSKFGGKVRLTCLRCSHVDEGQAVCRKHQGHMCHIQEGEPQFIVLFGGNLPEPVGMIAHTTGNAIPGMWPKPESSLSASD